MSSFKGLLTDRVVMEERVLRSTHTGIRMRFLCARRPHKMTECVRTQVVNREHLARGAIDGRGGALKLTV